MLKMIEDITRESCSCGRAHAFAPEIISGHGAQNALCEVLTSRMIRRPYVICDSNTYLAAGEKICALIPSDIKYTLYNFGKSPSPDERAVGAALMNMPKGTDAVIAVGSGVLNDIGKIISSAAGLLYIVVATAPSMDGYASATSSMTRGGLKVSISSKCPDVIIGDSQILAAAPTEMKISGLGDMIAKYTAIAEWRISNIVNGEYYCEKIAELIRTAVRTCVNSAERLLSNDEEAARAVFEGLILGGAAMSLAGCSRPASGCEHYISHIIDMRAAELGTSEDMHGIQCAAGTLITAKLYERLAKEHLSREGAEEFVAHFDKDAWSSRLRALIGGGAEAMIELEKKEQKYDKATHAGRLSIILSEWENILRVIKEEIPPACELEALFDKVGMPKELRALDKKLLPEVFRATKDIRDKYVLSRLLYDLGLLDKYAEWLNTED